jgi:lysophospholipase L1-like esterase
VLSRLTGRRVLNSGVPGEVTAEGLARLEFVLDSQKPALMILCHGGNDLLRQMDRQQAADNLRAMIRMAKGRGIPVMLVAVPALGITLSPPPFYAEVAKEFGIPLRRKKALAGILSKNALKSDYIHPNAGRYRRWPRHWPSS